MGRAFQADSSDWRDSTKLRSRLAMRNSTDGCSTTSGLSDPLAYRILGLSEDGIATRRWFCYVPAHGKPRAIVSAVEAHRLDALGVEKIVYRSHD